MGKTPGNRLLFYWSQPTVCLPWGSTIFIEWSIPAIANITVKRPNTTPRDRKLVCRRRDLNPGHHCVFMSKPDPHPNKLNALLGFFNLFECSRNVNTSLRGANYYFLINSTIWKKNENGRTPGSSRSYGGVFTRKPRRPSLVEILCRAWTGALINWGSAELLPDRSQLTAKAPRCDRVLLVSWSASSLHSCFYAVPFLLKWMVYIFVP